MADFSSTYGTTNEDEEGTTLLLTDTLASDSLDTTWRFDLQALMDEWSAELDKEEEDAVLKHLEEKPLQAPVTAGSASDMAPKIFRQRLADSLPLAGVRACVDWRRLVAIAGLDELSNLASEEEILSPKSQRRRKGTCVDVNSGGDLFFGILAPEPGHPEKEEAVVFKFCNARHRRQSEQMAAELAWRLGVSAPESKILLREIDEEWQDIGSSAEALCAELSVLLKTKQSMLVMQYVAGVDMQDEQLAWETSLASSAEALGRVLVLDMVLGNADRLAMKSLAWRGNPANLIWSSSHACVPIDAMVSRRPPKMHVKAEDARIIKLLGEILQDEFKAKEALLEAVSCNTTAISAVEANSETAVKTFTDGVRTGLHAAFREKELLEMLQGVIKAWFEKFHADMDRITGKSDWKGQTAKIAALAQQAEEDEKLLSHFGSWRSWMREQGMALLEVSEDWAARHGVSTPMAFRGFLGQSTLMQVRDPYELLLRLQQLVARITMMSKVAYLLA